MTTQIRCFVTGRARPKRAPSGVRRYFSDDWSDDTLPVNVFLVDHPKGLLLFDTGQTVRAAQRGYFPSWYPFFRLSRFELEADDEIAAQLERAGYDVADVRWVVLSHMHTDHVGGIDRFSSAEVLVSKVEWERAVGLKGRLRGYVPQHWPAAVRPRPVTFEGAAIGPFAGSYDVAGDGSLRLVPTPGHTEGHMSLLVSNGEPTYLLGGDSSMNARELAASGSPIAEFCERHGIVFLAAHDDAAAALIVPN